MVTWENFMIPDNEADLCRLAILLAMTPNQDVEKEVIAQYQKLGLRSAATMISGFGIDSQTSIVRSVVNLCLNTNVIERKRSQVHPVCHCVLETAQSTRASDAIGQNFCFKAAVVRRREESRCASMATWPCTSCRDTNPSASAIRFSAIDLCTGN